MKLKLMAIKQETPLVSSLIFAKGEKLTFVAGQYLNVTMPGKLTHGKAYTIASTPSDEQVTLTIKKQGKFSSALLELKEGEEVEVSEAQGYFFDNFSSAQKNVFIVGGIGITPFMSLLRDYVKQKKDLGELVVLYSNKFKQEITFYDELKKLNDQKILKLVNFVTQEKAEACEFGRINAEAIKKHVANYQNSHFYLCGSISFVNDMWKLLGGLSVPEEHIFTEAFF